MEERDYLILVSTAFSKQELLSRLQKEPMFCQAKIYDFERKPGDALREELIYLKAKYKGQQNDAPQDTENKDT